jgi:hypothetical protein
MKGFSQSGQCFALSREGLRGVGMVGLSCGRSGQIRRLLFTLGRPQLVDKTPQIAWLKAPPWVRVRWLATAGALFSTKSMAQVERSCSE